MEENKQAQPGPEPNTIIIPDAKLTSATTTEFNFSSWGKPTPQAAKNLFIIFYSMNTSVLGWISYTHLLPQPVIFETVGLFKFIIDPLCFIVSKMFGIVPIDMADEKPQ